ncbi:MAG: PKD domain-containing protein, partial [Chitinophagaceae bacterium]
MRVLTLFFLLISARLVAQPPCSSPGTTPGTATVVCGSTVFNQPNLPSCNGNTIPFPGCSGLVSDNAAFYSFHCYQAGTFGFLLTPLSGADDYDWCIMDITGFAPTDIYTNNLNISVNLSGTPGPTGCTPTGVGNSNCAGGTPQFNQMPMLQAGHDYLLMVSNWSSSGLGYNLTFTGGSTVLGDNAAPTVTNVGPVGCNSSQIRVQFSESVLCNTVTSSGSEFSITAGTNVITGVVSQCATGINAITELTIQLQDPLPAGNYNLVINNGSDGNTIHDVCQTP